jgi:ABC-type antimicrobial peptide transport system permease subunit
MLKNYIKIAWRNIVKNKFYSLVNIIGLSAGIAFTLLIGAYVWSELQVNKNLKNAKNQYIIQSKWKDPNQGLEITTVGPLAKALKEQYSSLVANFYRWDGITVGVSKDDKSFREGIQICDSTMFNMYGFKLVEGDPNTALNNPFSVVLTEDKAIKYFGKTNVVGQTITMENFAGVKHDFSITGVMKKPYKNSVTYITDDNDNQIYVATSNMIFFGRDMDWNNPYRVGYVELRPGVDPKALEKPMQHLLNENTPPQIAENMHPYLVPLNEYYLNANNGLIKKMLYALFAIAFFILLMAVVNFINLSVSRSNTRMREIGIRKVMGGLKKQLISQFLVESIVLVFFATIFALIIYMLTKDWASSVLQKDMPSFSQFPIYFIGLLIVLIIIVGFTAGIYPAFVLSSLKSIESLKGKVVAIKEKKLLRKSLVAFQFGIATIAFVGAMIISKQIQLFFSNNLGYNKDYIISVQLPRNWSPEGVNHMEYVRKEFAAMPQVADISLSFGIPNGNSPAIFSIYHLGEDSSNAISSQALYTDEYFASTYGIPMRAGVFYKAPGTTTDSSKIVINETMAKALGWNNPDDALGKQLKSQNTSITFTVAGVTKDFHFGSMQQAIQPVTFFNVHLFTVYRGFSFKLMPGDISSSLAAIQRKWSTLLPGAPFEYTFMDETLRRLYKTEIQLKQASYIATFLSLIIVLLGILGLVSLSIQRRIKEIGIRKVLGANVSGIIALFMKEVLPVIIIAGIVACPFAYLIMQRWLRDYTYRIDITITPFILAILLLSFITTILILIQTIKTALSNPVKSLRTE